MPRKKDEGRWPERPVTPPGEIDKLFPAVAGWVRTAGWIEIGDQEGFDFVVRALDYGGLVFESPEPQTLGEAMAALERVLAEDLQRR